ncbi:PHA granule structural protein PhaP (plasmid) [Haloferax mediterranei ATCC 33500]|uniref:PHA granule-associated protein PhaP n=2 Tax=Haloferax mediterranei (strain ATCC 33500 / DSM 1411 / JCM 8866 / NBRC 14739 / NCIMB 2177 / R-4) TaxID=523841 RepID=PHAP_HALMT|nr:PHA granule structural protein PhaP [Haloferax mediterranei]I3R9Z2.1 RecName: Full=PHA granule-associated protein PhaP; AltName: Full=Major haloarchaeal phasin [Haloferax mediterranei ATCC 33500]ACB10368.2 PhaP [Haloferax mediterranei]AEU08668.1 PhaP [Haloferax mediterranei]AFK21052.1 poly(3-hydroxyalkanoate) granule-associated protein(phasin) [Haloferax mediterranei ATCC 33500]AHZ24088.1 hypothetical protein BM92_17940 [Haloferax mediterranei ATCC 33500]EMA05163.1 hypothetical protein C43
MSEQANPFTQFFQLQRRSIEQSQRSMHQGIEFQKQVTRMMVDGMKAQQSVSRKGTDFARTAVKSYFEMMDSSVPGDNRMYADVKDAMDEQFDSIDEMTEQTWDVMEESFEENADAMDEIMEQSLEYLDDATEVYLEGLQEIEETSAQVTPDTPE